MRNEAACIAGCLASVLASELPPGVTIEVLVLDGQSTDDSPAIVADMALRDRRIRLLPNPARLQAAAFNQGLAAARGQYLVRMDAHSVYAPDYIAECLRLLESTGAGNVGGVQQATGSSWLGPRDRRRGVVTLRRRRRAVPQRHQLPGFTDTVYLGAWRTATLRELGGMRTDWAVNEDYEMNVRLRASGGTVYLSPTIRSTYQVRSSAVRLARQYARYGFWKVRTLLEHPASLRWRQLVRARIRDLGTAHPMAGIAVRHLGRESPGAVRGGQCDRERNRCSPCRDDTAAAPAARIPHRPLQLGLPAFSPAWPGGRSAVPREALHQSGGPRCACFGLAGQARDRDVVPLRRRERNAAGGPNHAQPEGLTGLGPVSAVRRTGAELP